MLKLKDLPVGSKFILCRTGEKYMKICNRSKKGYRAKVKQLSKLNFLKPSSISDLSIHCKVKQVITCQ